MALTPEWLDRVTYAEGMCVVRLLCVCIVWSLPQQVPNRGCTCVGVCCAIGKAS